MELRRGCMTFLIAALVASTLLQRECSAGIDLVTLPSRNTVQLTIYNSADLTLVREVRNLTLQKGLNKLSFGWANTLIDPTSLDLRAIGNAAAVKLMDVSYPPRINTEAVWLVQSAVEGETPVEIRFFTSGITWRAFYMGTLSQDEKEMLLEGYVVVANTSGEDYADAQTRLIVGQVHLLDEIAELARRPEPYGRPGPLTTLGAGTLGGAVNGPAAPLMTFYDATITTSPGGQPKEILKEGLSEYFLYTIEGTETIPDKWSKRLPAFKPVRVPVLNLYKYDEAEYGEDVVRMLYFKNDKEHKLGDTPLPDGSVKVYRTADKDGHLSYEGECDTKYIPVGQEVELNLGAAAKVKVEPKLMKTVSSAFVYDRNRDISGWDETEDWRVEVKNLSDTPAKIEIMQHLKHQYADEVKRAGGFGAFEKVDMDRIKFTLMLEPRSTKTFNYTVTYHEGDRRQER
jgi:hypothetical protein